MQNTIRTLAVGWVIALCSGCASTNWNWFKPANAGDAAAKPGASPTVQGLIAYLNENASRVRSIRVDDMSVDATMGTQSIALQGRLLAEKPRNFRMKATFLGKEEVDIGSNLNEFWFWAQRNPEQYQYFCTYRDLNEGKVRAMPLPIQPEWVMETLGLGPFGPADKYKLEPDGPNTLRLVEKITSPQGMAVRKVIVMNRKEMKTPQPQVTAFLLIDDKTNQEICSAHILSTKVDRVTGAILPHKMDIRVPREKISMALKLDGLAVNASIVETAFQRQMMMGVDPFNLATRQVEPWGPQRTQGFK